MKPSSCRVCLTLAATLCYSNKSSLAFQRQHGGTTGGRYQQQQHYRIQQQQQQPGSVLLNRRHLPTLAKITRRKTMSAAAAIRHQSLDSNAETDEATTTTTSISSSSSSSTTTPQPQHQEQSSHSSTRSFSAILSRIRPRRRRNNKKNKEKKSAEASDKDLIRLKRENSALREAVQQLEVENERLHQEANSRIVLETFEGEGKIRKAAEEREIMINGGGGGGGSNGVNGLTKQQQQQPVTLTGEEMLLDGGGQGELWCDVLEEGACPVEPTVSFEEALRDRAYWLVGLLVLQSLSGIILARNEALLSDHPVIVYFLTMLVGAGGNAGNQASVRVIRGLALGTLNERTQNQFLTREFKMAVSLSIILSTAGFLRAAVFRTPLPETLAVTSALSLIVFSSICLGAVLPLFLKRLGVDPAHSSTTIQVIMDILGVVLAVFVSNLLLESPLGHMLVTVLSKKLG